VIIPNSLSRAKEEKDPALRTVERSKLCTAGNSGTLAGEVSLRKILQFSCENYEVDGIELDFFFVT
jgi:hypothetical protein